MKHPLIAFIWGFLHDSTVIRPYLYHYDIQFKFNDCTCMYQIFIRGKSMQLGLSVQIHTDYSFHLTETVDKCRSVTFTIDDFI